LGALVNRVIIAALIVVGLSSTTAAQLAAPRPEHARLDTFAGRWTIDGESEGGKVLLSETCEWFPGRFHLVCRREGKGPRGTVAGHSIMTWEASANTYAMITINSNGASLIAHGTLADNVWTWNGTVDVAGRALKVRLTTTSQSPSAYTSVAEASIDGKWVAIENARATKMQSGLAGKWTGVDQNNHPVTLELVVKGEEATGTLAIGPDPVKTVDNGKVEGTTVTFTTPSMMNGREIPIAWRGELKDDRLAFTRRLVGGPEMSPLSLQRAAK